MALSPAVIGEAIRRQAASDLPATFDVGDAAHPRFHSAPSTPAAPSRCSPTCPTPQAALGEAVRVVRSGGPIGVIDADAAR